MTMFWICICLTDFQLACPLHGIIQWKLYFSCESIWNFVPICLCFFSNTDKIRCRETSTERLFSDNEFHITQYRKSHTPFTEVNGMYSFFVRKTGRTRRPFTVIIIVGPLYSVHNWELLYLYFICALFQDGQRMIK